MFFAEDVAVALGYTEPSVAVKSHCHRMKKYHSIIDLSGSGEHFRVIDEKDLGYLAVKADPVIAERFNGWTFAMDFFGLLDKDSYSKVPISISRLCVETGLAVNEINKKLENASLQINNGGWILTDKGMQYAIKKPYKTTKDCGYCILWFRKVIPLLF